MVSHARIFTGCATYGEYLDSLYGTVPLKMVSFDVYPVLFVKSLEKGGRLGGAPVTLKERWYETLEIASSFARRRKVPMYAFALATSHGRYPVPTKAHLRLQMYSNLAHGAQLLQYFRYRAVAPWAKRSALFELIREMNQEIQARAGERARAQGRHLRPCRRLRRPVLAGARRRRRLRRARGGGAWSR